MNEKTDGALDADLMRTIGVPFESCHLIGWHNAATMARWLRADEGSYTWRAEHPEEASYREGLQHSAQLADIYDLLCSFAVMFAQAHSKSKPKQPGRYPRPWEKNERKIGRGAIPVADFDDWYYGGE